MAENNKSKSNEGEAFINGYKVGQAKLAGFILDFKFETFADWKYILAKLDEIKNNTGHI